ANTVVLEGTESAELHIVADDNVRDCEQSINAVGTVGPLADNARILLKVKAIPALASYNKGLTYLERGQFSEAIDPLNETIRINPKFRDAYHKRAIAFLEICEFKKAVEDETKGLDISDNELDRHESYLNRAAGNLVLKHFDEVITDCAK